MARRTFSVGLVDDVENIGATAWDDIRDVLKPDPQGYVSIGVDGSPFERLLWREVKKLKKRARLTDWQDLVFSAFLNGFSQREIAELYRISRTMVRVHLEAAQMKCATVPHRGLLTVMIEELGWPAVRESLADKLEITLKHAHPSH